MNALRSVVAIGAGFFATSVLALVGDYGLRAWMPGEFGPEGSLPGAKILAITLICTGVFGAIGGYIAARIAQLRPVMHSAIVGGIVLALTALATVFTWAAAPAWYHLATLAMVLPVAVLGGKFREMQMKQAAT
jgi:hypothetical protein